IVTGASTGFGRELTEQLLGKGDKVIATLRKPEVLADLTQQYPSSQLLVLPLDVTRPEQIADAFKRAGEAFGRIDVVFNNAGMAAVGEVENTSDEVARRVMETNFWGAKNVSVEAVRFFRDVNKPAGGRLLQHSSTSGMYGTALVGFYAASAAVLTCQPKALEGMSEALADELNPEWNIKVTIIGTGPANTIVFNSAPHASVHPAYENNSSPMMQYMRQWHASPQLDGDPKKICAIIDRIAHLEDPPMRVPLLQGAISEARRKLKRVEEEVARFESWSESL
ncbi:NAD(P)-binding protein, partial [Coniophora puteana RWD-64-598 SS2]